MFLAIIHGETEKHIGNVKLGPINWIHRFADVGIMIGEKEMWGHGIGTDAIRLVSEYAFSKLHLHKLNTGVLLGNKASIKAFRKAGFAGEGSRDNQYRIDSSHLYTDDFLMGMINPQEVSHIFIGKEKDEIL